MKLTGSLLLNPLLSLRNPMSNYFELARLASCSLPPCLLERLSILAPAGLY